MPNSKKPRQVPPQRYRPLVPPGRHRGLPEPLTGPRRRTLFGTGRRCSPRRWDGDETSSVIEPIEPLELDTLPAVLERASSHTTTSIPIAGPHETAGAVRERLIGRSYDTVAGIPVCVDRGPVGMVRLEALLAADHDVAVCPR